MWRSGFSVPHSTSKWQDQVCLLGLTFAVSGRFREHEKAMDLVSCSTGFRVKKSAEDRPLTLTPVKPSVSQAAHMTQNSVHTSGLSSAETDPVALHLVTLPKVHLPLPGENAQCWALCTAQRNALQRKCLDQLWSWRVPGLGERGAKQLSSMCDPSAAPCVRLHTDRQTDRQQTVPHNTEHPASSPYLVFVWEFVPGPFHFFKIKDKNSHRRS